QILHCAAESHNGVKIYLGIKGKIITFCFNVALAEGNDTAEILTNAAILTVSDVVGTKIMSSVCGRAAGPTGWALLINEVMDDLTYDQKIVDQSYERQHEYCQEMKESVKANDPIACWQNQIMLNEEREANNARVISHQIAEASRFFGQVINDCVNGVMGVDNSEKKEDNSPQNN
ncbi:MAG: hypothetical protein ACK4PR_11690, partial [Gammaproteobacteria bacterium]